MIPPHIEVPPEDGGAEAGALAGAIRVLGEVVVTALGADSEAAEGPVVALVAVVLGVAAVAALAAVARVQVGKVTTL